jgi:hypothetical protein
MSILLISLELISPNDPEKGIPSRTIKGSLSPVKDLFL